MTKHIHSQRQLEFATYIYFCKLLARLIQTVLISYKLTYSEQLAYSLFSELAASPCISRASNAS